MDNIRKNWAIITVIGGIAVGALVGEIKKAVVIERFSETQVELLESNAVQHKVFDTRLTEVEKWQARKEGYDAAMAEMEKRNADGD